MQQLIDTYAGIMASLATLPDEIAGYQSDLTEAKMRKAETDKHLARIEAGIVAEAGGWKALGSNEKERELALPALLRKSVSWFALDGELTTLTRTVAEMADELAAAERQYGAVCYMARLHGALLTYLGNSGAPADVALPTTDFFVMTSAQVARNDNGAATVANAEELGL